MSGRGESGYPGRAAWIAGAALRALGALLLSAALLVGLPAILTIAAGWPLPHGLPSIAEIQTTLTAQGIPDQLLINIMACLGWLLWTSLLVSFVVELLAVVARIPVPRLPGLSPAQAVAAALLGAITISLPGGRPAPAQAVSAALPAASVARADDGHLAGTSRAGTGPSRMYTVRAAHDGVHDSLWRIADHELGDGRAWPAIFRLNRGQPQPDGRKLRHPDLIQPGWRLRLPEQVAKTEGKPASSPRASSPTPPPASSSVAAPPTPSQSTAAPTAPAHSDSALSHGVADRGVQLPDGGYVGLGMAAAIGSALVLWRRRRRQVSLSRWPTEIDTENVHEPALPLAVRIMRRADLNPNQDEDELSIGPIDVQPAEVAEAIEHQPSTSAHPAVAIGLRDGRQISLRDIPDGLNITGPGAMGVARAMVTTALASASGSHPEDRPLVVMPIADASTILGSGGLDLSGHPGLCLTESLTDTLAMVEAEIVHRLRTLADYEVATPDQLAQAHPDEESMSPMLFVACASGIETSEDRARLVAVRSSGVTVDVHLVLLGNVEMGTTCEVTADGAVANATGGGDAALRDGRLFSITQAEAEELLQVARQTTEPAVIADPASAHARPARPAQAPRRDGPSSSVVARVDVLGPLRIEAGGEEIVTGLRSTSRELLAYLALRPDGATGETIVEALWPDRSPDPDNTRLHSALKSLRSRLRSATGARNAMFVTHVAGRYRLDTQLVASDVTDFRSLIGEATASPDGDHQIAALKQAVQLYRGELVDGSPYEWAEPIREELRRSGTDAMTHLASLIKDTKPDQALAVLNRAIGLDPYNEELYGRIMRLQTTIDHPDAAQRTLRLLESRLDEIDAQPSEKIRSLLITSPATRSAATNR